MGPKSRRTGMRFWISILVILGVLAPGGFSAAQELRPLAEVEERAWSFPKIPVQREEVAEGVWRSTGVSNAYLVQVPGGYVLIDSGLPHQARAQMKLLEERIDGPLLYIVLTHSHIDHAGGAKLWAKKYPDAKIVAHEAFPAMQQTLVELAPYFSRRGAMAMPALVASTGGSARSDPLLAQGGIEPDILVDDDEPLSLSFGDFTLDVLPMPGGEGADGLTVWLPEQAILFTGDLTGPHFPAFPNLYSIRGERYREFLPYVRSLNAALALEPRVIAHGHFDVIRGKAYIREALARQRDAVQSVHDQTVAGMNAGKGLTELMQEVEIPTGLELSEGYGRVSWSVRALWETYTGWFDFESTTSLYPVPARHVYPDLVDAAGGVDPILEKARARLAADEPVAALHLVEVAEAVAPSNTQVLALKRKSLETLRERAVSNHNNFYEVSWLDARLLEVREAQALASPD